MDFLNLLSQYRTPAGDVFFQGITLLAQETFVVVVICWLFWCSNKKLAYCLGFTYFTSGLLVQGLKITFRVPRPWLLDPAFEPVASAVPGATGYSFPSGHTQSITALLGTLGLYTRKKPARFLCALFILLVGFSRMYLGCHTPQDVIVSFLVTFLCVTLCYSFLYKKDFSAGKELLISLCMAAVCAALLIYTAVLYKNGTIEFHYAQDCIKACGAGFALCCRLLYYRNSYFFYSSGFHPETYHSFCCGNSSDAAYPDRTEAFDRRISSSFFSAVFYSCYMDRNGLSVSLFQKKIRFLLFRNYFKEFPDRQKHLPELVFLPGGVLLFIFI